MAIDRNTLRQLERWLRPMATRLANSIARVVISRVDDDENQQNVQLGALADEDIDDAEHFQPYGFSAVPLVGAEGIAVFPNGDREHPLVFAVSDRRHRPTGGEPGEVTVYHHSGSRVLLLDDGSIEVRPASGQQVLVREVGGSTDSLVTRSEFNAHTHTVETTGTAAAQSGTAAPPTEVTGTVVLKAQ